MLFGDLQQFAIETGVTEQYPNSPGVYVQIRFWVDGITFGDWEDRIPRDASLSSAMVLLANTTSRREKSFHGTPAEDIMREVYDGFFAFDYLLQRAEIPNRRDRYHLDDIGAGSLADKFGVVLITDSTEVDRLIVKDLRSGEIIADRRVTGGIVEASVAAYAQWIAAL